jgi:4,5-dihydroxyphthalate decarboxylase
MSKITLTVACDDFDFVRPLKDGTVRAEGLDLVFVDGMNNPERHALMVRELAFDVCELNISTYLIARDRGLPLTALPIFLYRKFRHGFIFVNRNAGIATPADLKGKRVGCPNYQPASNVWIRGILQDHYGISHRDLIWVTEIDEEIAFDSPDGVRIERMPAGKTMDSMLTSGEIDAVIAPLVPKSILAGDPRVARLFPDYKEREIDYFRRTGMFPIMHVTAVKQDTVDRYPWIMLSLTKALETAKHAAYKRAANVRVLPLAWGGTGWEEERHVLGPDPWPNGLGDANRKTLETTIRYCREQGLIRRDMTVDELFDNSPLGH